MAYIGKLPTVGNFQICDAISVVNGQAAYTMQVGSVNVLPETANHMIVSLNGVIQAPNSSYTVSGSTITFASNLVTNDVIDFIQILGSVLDLGVPSDATVSTAKLASTSVTAAKLNNDIITGQTALTSVASDDTVLISDTSASGALKKMTRANFVSGIGGTNTPSFFASNTGGQSANSNTATKLAFSNEVWDVGGVYDASTNYRFTPGFAGKSNISCGFWSYDAQSKIFRQDTMIYKNGSELTSNENRFTSGDTSATRKWINFNMNVAHDADDYFEMYGRVQTTDSGSVDILSSSGSNSQFYNYFTAFKIIE